MCSKALGAVENAPESLFLDPASGAELLGVKLLQFNKIWDDRKTGSQPFPIGFWRPVPPKGFYIIGDYAERSQEQNPKSFVYAIAERSTDTKSEPLLATPVDFIEIWNSNHTSALYGECYLWKPIAPPGYIAMGFIATDTPKKPVIKSQENENGIPYACVRVNALRRSGLHVFPESREGFLWTYSRGFFSLAKNCTLYSPNGLPGLFLAIADTPKALPTAIDGYSFLVADNRKSVVIDTKPNANRGAPIEAEGASDEEIERDFSFT